MRQHFVDVLVCGEDVASVSKTVLEALTYDCLRRDEVEDVQTGAGLGSEGVVGAAVVLAELSGVDDHG